jgi:hypothetical protein
LIGASLKRFGFQPVNPATLAVAAVVAALGCSSSGTGSSPGTGGDGTATATGGSAASGSGGTAPLGGGGTAGPGTGGMAVVGGTGGLSTGGGGGTAISDGGATSTGGLNGGATGTAGAGGSPSVGGSGGSSPAGSGGAAGGSSGAVGNLKGYIVITSKGTPTPGDMVMIGRMMANGFAQVTPITDALVTPQMVADGDLVVISSSAESAPLQAKLKDIAVPVLCIEDAEYTKMGMASMGNHDANISTVVIATAGSPLVGDETGTVTIASKPGDLGWGTPAATALVGATMPGNTGHAAIFGYAKGAQMSGMVAPAKRAGFAIREALAAGLSADGIKLFDAILKWVTQ